MRDGPPVRRIAPNFKRKGDFYESPLFIRYFVSNGYFRDSR